MYLRPAHSFRKPDRNVKPGTSQHKNNYSEMKKKRQQECEKAPGTQEEEDVDRFVTSKTNLMPAE